MLNRLTQLQIAKKNLDHAFEWDMENVEKPARILIDLLVDITSNPLPASNPQRRIEAYRGEEVARYLFAKSPFFLNYCGWFDQVYQLIQDPTVLSESIISGLMRSHNGDKQGKYEEMLSRSLALGGVLLPEHISSNSNLINPIEARKRYRFAGVDQAKQLAHNQMENHWATEAHRNDTFQYGNFMIFLLGYVADEDPSWVVEFIQKNSQALQETVSQHTLQGGKIPENRPFECALLGAMTPRLFLAIKRICPAVHDSLVNSPFWTHYVEMKAHALSDFKISDLITRCDDHVESPFTEADAIHLLIRSAKTNALTRSRYADFEKVWQMSGFEGVMFKRAMASDQFQSLAKEVADYRAFIRRCDLSGDDVQMARKSYRHFGSEFPFLDALMHKKADRLSASEQYMDNHSAFMLAGNWMSQEVGCFPVKRIILETAILGCEINKRNERLSAFVLSALTDPSHHSELAKLSAAMLDKALEQHPKLDKSLLRKVNWIDHTIKGRMLEDDLGM